MKAALLACVALFAATYATVVLRPAASGLALKVESDGSYSVSVDGVQWLTSSPSALFMYYKWQPLTLKSTSDTSGRDALGAYNEHAITWTILYGIRWQTIFRVYSDAPIIVFEQFYMDGANATSQQTQDDVSSAFPAFNVNNDCGSYGYLQFGGEFFKPHYGKWCYAASDFKQGIRSGPLSIFSKDMSRSLVISPMNQFMMSSSQLVNGTVRWGLESACQNIYGYSDFRLSTIMYLGNGLNDAFAGWGAALTSMYNRKSTITRDFSLRTLGYWTDNGGYYYYIPEVGKNMEETLLDVHAYAQTNKIPYRYLQLDSWWYPKGPNKGVVTWTALPSVFPNGLYNLYQKTQWPIVAHNRFWSNMTTYSKDNGGNFWFAEDQNGFAWPDDQTFWPWLMSSSREWGLIVYEQDWLDLEYEKMDILTDQPYAATQWLQDMGNAADDNDITIQYCMALPRHLLQSVTIPAVTQVRASTDYQPGNDQWKIGLPSLFAWALGVAPSKDDFWTTTNQPGAPPYPAPFNHEPYPELQACVATYSLGPVGPSDGIGYTNVSMLMRSVRSDGVLLQPDAPFLAIDLQIVNMIWGTAGPAGELWTSHSIVSGLRFNHILAANLSSSYIVTAASLGVTARTLAYSNRVAPSGSGAIDTPTQEFDASHALTLSKCGMSDFQLWHTAPILPNGYVILGELGKWVPIASARISEIGYDSANVYVHLNGVYGEVVPIYFATQSSGVWSVNQQTCYFGQSTTTVLTLPSGQCTPA